MKRARRVQASFEAFARGFLHPLLTGGELRVDRPATPGMLESFALSRPSDTELDQEIYHQLYEAAGEVAPVRALPWPDHGLSAVAMAAYDLLVVTDPALSRWPGRRARARTMQWIDYLVEQAGAPRTRGEALGRHALLSRVLELRRGDTVAQSWGFRHDYQGRPVPDGFFTKPRWVRRTTSRRSVTDLWASLDEELGTLARLRALLARSPVTQLLRTDLFPDLYFGAASLAVISDDHIRSGVARALVEQGDPVAAPLGRALRQLASLRPSPRLLFYPIALIYEAHVIAALDAGGSEGSVFRSPRSPDAALFLAMLPAMLGAPDGLGALLELSPDDMELLRRWADGLDAAAGAEASSLAATLIDRAEPPPPEPEREDAGLHEVGTS